ncbi:MAG: hypothetical protein AB2A00_42425 [Myxococcota bacterium]
MPRTPRPDDALLQRPNGALSITRLERRWRNYARARGLPRPTPDEKQLMPPGLAAAVVTPLVTQGFLASRLEAQAGARVARVELDEEDLRPALPRESLWVELEEESPTVWSARCSQPHGEVARVRVRFHTDGE